MDERALSVTLALVGSNVNYSLSILSRTESGSVELLYTRWAVKERTRSEEKQRVTHEGHVGPAAGAMQSRMMKQ